MNRIFIVRHGNTFEDGEPPRRIGRRTDLPLTPTGRQQALRLGQWFQARGIDFSRALAGKSRRTTETAQLILDEQAAAPALEWADWLTEIDYGIDENQPEATVLARLGPAALADWDERAVAPIGWDVDSANRRSAWRRLFAVPPAGNSLLATSNGAARFALFALARRPAIATLKLRTGAFGEIAIDGSGSPTLVGWNELPD